MLRTQADRGGEETVPHGMDDVIPSRGDGLTPLVGIAGAQGSAAALQDLLALIPPRTGLAFMAMIDDKAAEPGLAARLQEATTMKLVEVQSPVAVEPDTFYVVRPGPLAFSPDGRISVHMEKAATPAGAPLDLFLRGLADAWGPHSAAVLLPGGDSEGVVGIRRIKEQGGLTVLTQSPHAEQEAGMAQAAMDVGMVDWVLQPADIARRLPEYFRQEGVLDEEGVEAVLALLRQQAGHDFSPYKRETVLRRITRRMQLTGVQGLAAYLQALEGRPDEVTALVQDLLVSVSNFFRDPGCFDALARQVPDLFRRKHGNEAVRVWVAGCATGEEAYSVAMLLSEQARTLQEAPAFQILATDVNEAAIQAAREGRFATAVEADLSPERLRRFFVREPHGWRVRPELRDRVLFARHDLLNDPPFWRMDLVCCRNVLVDLDAGATKRVLDAFHFALQPEGCLMLGASESVDADAGLFAVLDGAHRLYARRAGGRKLRPPAQQAAAPEPAREQPASRGDIHLRLIEQLVPPSALVDGAQEVVHLSPNAGRFLRHPGGEPTRDLLQLVHPGLRLELRAALLQARQSRMPVQVGAMHVDLDTGPAQVAMRVVPASAVGEDLYLVLFESPPAQGGAPTGTSLLPAGGDAVAHQLDGELERLRLHLRDTVERYEASAEELKASNEELEATNEELHSATGELESHREELQATNEELSTVNQALQSKVNELSQANLDMHNFMGAAAIAIVFLDRELRITRYTPAAVKLFGLRPGDTGRPLAHLASRLQYPELAADAQAVLHRLVPVEREVGHEDGSWYLARLLPYRGFDERIDGVVLSFVDITDRKQAEEVRKWLSTVVDSTTDGIISFGLDRRILSWNVGAEGMFGYTAQESIGQTASMLRPESESVMAEHLQRLHRGESLQFEALCRRKDGSEMQVSFTVSPIRGRDGQVIGGTAIARDVTEARQAQEALVRSQAELVEALERNLMARRELEVADAAKDRFIAVLSHELRNPLASITSSAEVLAAEELAPSARAHAAEVVRRQARSMRSLLDDLLDVARIRLGRLELHMEPLVLQDAVSQALETVQPLVESRGHRLEAHIPDAPLRVQADRLRLTQLLANLVGNAAKYTPTGGRIELSVEAQGDKAIVWVQDNGIGIDPGEIESMFELFAQSDDAARRRTNEGLGIGLSLARSIATLHQGTLTARSEGRGQGTRFELQLPLLDAQAANEGGEPPTKAAPGRSPTGVSQGQTILIADDNEDAVWALRKLLELAGFQVVTAGTGREALAQAEQHRPAVVLLDIGLPDITGHEVARRIRAEPWGREMKLVAVTGWGQDSDKRMSQAAGFNAHMTKPLDSSDIRGLLEDLGPGTMPLP